MLLAASLITLVAVLTTVGVFIARRVWRYPLFLIGAAIRASLGVGYPCTGHAGGHSWLTRTAQAAGSSR